MTAPPVSTTMLDDTRTFVEQVVLPNVTAWDHGDVLPPEALARVVELGIPGALVPAAYGGREATVAELAPVWRTLSQGWISLTGAVNTTALGTALLLRHGTEEQRQRWLPSIASGETLSSFSITEPGAGSDLSRLATTARRLPGGGLALDGEKRWIAGGLSYPLAFMLARVEGADRPSCVVLPADGRGEPSWEARPLDKLGYRGVESAAWRFRDHHAPRAEVLGGEEGLGRGARQMLDVLGVGRVNVACRGLGILDRALACALGEATGREIGGGLLGDFTHTQLRIGELRVRQLGVEALISRAAVAIDEGDPDTGSLASAAKLLASESAVWAVDLAARLAASRSYAAEDELARLRRDAPQTQIGEGANDALLLALGRGSVRDYGERMGRAA